MILQILLFTISTASAKVDFYKGDKVLSFTCNVDLKEPFSCVCLHAGLWKIYSSCLETQFIGVKNKYCFSPREMIKRVEKISEENSILSVSNSKETVEFKGITIKIANDDELVTRKPVTISDGRISACLAELSVDKKEHYCIYEANDLLSSIQTLSPNCTEGVFILRPKECIEVLDDVSTCPINFKLSNSLEELKRQKRMLQPLPVNTAPLADNSVPEDEDFWDSDNNENPYGAEEPIAGDTVAENPIILTEIWNYLDQQLDEVLELGNMSARTNSMQPFSVYRLLEASKQIILKTCPEYYVLPEFFDLAVEVFTSTLIRRNFLREFDSNYESLNRIMRALKKCRENVTQFPFIDESVHDECEDSSQKSVVGAYEIFGNKSEIVVHEKMESWEYDPIIDTVWKIFVNAYQYCFDFFEMTSDDVFRYATIMEALFQGDIHDIWTSGKTKGHMFGGFLGNVQEITQNVTLCMGSSGLETSFPFNLNRPVKAEIPQMRYKRHALEESRAVVCTRGKDCSDAVPNYWSTSL